MTEQKALQILWDYLQLHQRVRPADALLVFCSNDIRVAEYAAELWHEFLAPIVIVSGDGTKHHSALLHDTHQGKTEAEVFAGIMRNADVPADKIFIENKANNTAENFSFTKQLAEQNQLSIQTAIIVQKPYMERRTYATGKVVWPELTQILTSPPLTFEDYINGPVDRATVVNLLVGDLQRIKEYPKRGWQITQPITENVWNAFEYLVTAGYDKHLL